MPIYEYRCTTCGHIEEVFAKMSDAPPTNCESCEAETLEKILFPVSVHYKGSGFYATDYGSAKRPAGSNRDSDSSRTSGGDGGSVRDGSGSEKSSPAQSSSDSGAGSSSGGADSGSKSSSTGSSGSSTGSSSGD